MNLNKSSNPTFSEKIFEKALTRNEEGGVMSFTGAVNKSIILFLLVLLSGIATWKLIIVGNSAASYLAIGGAIGAFILAIVTSFKPDKSAILAPMYALCEGLFLGAISAIFNATYNGIVMQAIIATVCVVAVVFLCYRAGILKATPTFTKVLVFATLGIGVFYLISILLRFAGIDLSVFSLGWLGIIIQLVIVGVAALNLVLDFNQIDTGVEMQSPKFMEWYCAFGLMVTIVWIYIEILRLLAVLSRRN
ncbi:MAG: Bax inhibitor-1/YccA family protein [Bacteroidales bacterium]|nr:Bax inhibitor-1/YccA family protein [Bacteroidales bacterium]